MPANWGRFQFLADQDVDDGSVFLKAKEARRVGAGIQLKHLPGDEYSIGYWSDPSNALDWKDIPIKPGRYEVELQYGCGNGKNSAFAFVCGTQTLQGKTENTGGWESYATLRLGTLEITEASASFALRATTAEGGLMDFKALRLIPASN